MIHHQKISPENILDHYIEAANRHDMDALRGIFASDVHLRFGSDEFSGIESVLGPHEFDAGANTALKVSNIKTVGDGIEFELTESNDVLSALGIPELHHYVRVELRGNIIQKMETTRPPKEDKFFVEQITNFMEWLKSHDPDSYHRIWPDGKFRYSRTVGHVLPDLIKIWNSAKINHK